MIDPLHVVIKDMVTKPPSRQNAKNILGLRSVEDALLPHSVDHVVVELWRDLPRPLRAVHSYHPPVVGTELADSTLCPSTLT